MNNTSSNNTNTTQSLISDISLSHSNLTTRINDTVNTTLQSYLNNTTSFHNTGNQINNNVPHLSDSESEYGKTVFYLITLGFILIGVLISVVVAIIRTHKEDNHKNNFYKSVYRIKNINPMSTILEEVEEEELESIKDQDELSHENNMLEPECEEKLEELNELEYRINRNNRNILVTCAQVHFPRNEREMEMGNVS